MPQRGAKYPRKDPRAEISASVPQTPIANAISYNRFPGDFATNYTLPPRGEGSCLPQHWATHTTPDRVGLLPSPITRTLRLLSHL